MSKLLQHIQAQTTGNRYSPLERMKYTNVEQSFETYKNPAYLEEYRIDVRVGSTARVEAGNKAALSQRIEKAKYLIIEEVFGEFRMPLRELEAAIYDRDFDKAKELVEDIYKTMFY